jgi:type IV pilus assembly protein PilC
MRNAIDIIQLGISMVIMVVLTALTIVSSETATIRPKNPAMGETVPVSVVREIGRLT